MVPSERTQDDLLISKREILTTLFRRKYGMLAIFLASVGAAAFSVYYLISPTYESQAVLILSSSYLTEPLRDGPPESDFEKLAMFHTQRDIIQSERIAAEAVRRTNLAATRVIGRVEQIQISLGEVKRWVGELLGIERWQTPWSAEVAAIAAVHDWVRTFALPDSKAIRVTFRAKDPREAATVLTAVLEAHNDYYHSVIRERAAGVSTFLQEEHDRTRQSLADIESALLRFKEQDRLAVNGLSAGGGPRQRSPSIVGVTDSMKVQDELRLYILKLEEELRVANHIVDNEHRERLVGDLTTRLQTYVNAVNSMPERELTLVRLKRQFDTANENFQLLQRNLTKAKLVASGETERIRLVEMFQPPIENDDIVFPQKRLVLILAAMLGAILAFTWAFVVEYLDHTVRSAFDVERYLGLRLLASLKRLD
jgi:uncharacterized protein involved in exopolysaccharide biosynthesis